MEEIKVNDYVRSKMGSFGKITRIEENKFLYENKTLITWIGNVKKHSPNIIDLIEVGDILEVEVGGFVHKYEVYASTYYPRAIHDVNYETKDLEAYIEDYCNGKFNIVTHEQFNSIKYEVE